MAARRKILVVGSRGRLGQALMRGLDDRYVMLGADHGDLDITDHDRVMTVIGTIRPDIVLHAAAMTKVDACEQDSAAAFRVNADGTRYVADACGRVGARLVYFSTDYVFDGRKSSAYLEADAPNPLNVYGRSKLAGEQMAVQHCPDAAIMRVAWLYGAEGGSFVRTMLHHARLQMRARAQHHTGQPLRIVANQIGTPTWTEDVARQVAKVIEQDMNGVVHAVAHGEASWLDWATAIFKLAGLEVATEGCAANSFWHVAQRPARSVLQNGRLAAAGADIMRPWQEALADFLSRHREELLT